MIHFGDVEPHEMLKYNQLIARRLEEDGVRRHEDAEGVLVDEFRHRFPEWPVLQAPDKVRRILPELALMSTDVPYLHRLSGLHNWTLHHCLMDWAEDTQTDLENATTLEERQCLEADLDLLYEMLECCFDDLDFLDAAVIAVDFLRGGTVVDRLDVHLGELLELLPLDIREQVESRLQSMAAGDHTDDTPPPDAGSATDAATLPPYPLA